MYLDMHGQTPRLTLSSERITPDCEAGSLIPESRSLRPLRTMGTIEALLSTVELHVIPEMCILYKAFSTNLTHMSFILLMDSSVHC